MNRKLFLSKRSTMKPWFEGGARQFGNAPSGAFFLIRALAFDLQLSKNLTIQGGNCDEKNSAKIFSDDLGINVDFDFNR